MKNILTKYPFLVIVISMLSAVASIGLFNWILGLCIDNTKIVNTATGIMVIPLGLTVLIIVIQKLSKIKNG